MYGHLGPVTNTGVLSIQGDTFFDAKSQPGNAGRRPIVTAAILRVYLPDELGLTFLVAISFMSSAVQAKFASDRANLITSLNSKKRHGFFFCFLFFCFFLLKPATATSKAT